ncbi:hypothetical protein scyTo_0018735 [Scyliorhinus torazame]|uniref:Uncharacterized protein n=1 Tax=Scyliorhinus torazame TaxID=75743 RepID=A0A401Q1S4_SCYTO|nr:hypothetical protein [Scyliorhinus torazame]
MKCEDHLEMSLFEELEPYDVGIEDWPRYAKGMHYLFHAEGTEGDDQQKPENLRSQLSNSCGEFSCLQRYPCNSLYKLNNFTWLEKELEKGSVENVFT